MFKQRLLTLLALIPLVLLAIYYASSGVFFGVVVLLVALGGWEWLKLIPASQLISKLIFLLVLIAAVWLSSYWFDYWLMLGLVTWGLIFLAVVTFPASQQVWGYRVVVGSLGLLLLPLFASSIMGVYNWPQGKNLFVYLLCLVWAADIGAYLAGKFCGRHKLIARVSPGKTIEGALGGFMLSMLVAVVGLFLFSPSHAICWFVIAAATTVISMLGDLFISMLKRRQKLKDTGSIFPGHGGVLDRIDSLIAASPLFYYGLHFIPSGL